jgi:hypothetical protein
MKVSKRETSVIYWGIFSFILLIIIFKWIHYLTSNDYILYCKENFEPINYNSELMLSDVSGNSASADLPLTTTYTCNNFCGPPNRCSKTGQQCFADSDCPGCEPYVPPLKKAKGCVPGDNDAGKLVYNQNPRYSSLTTDIGTQARLYIPSNQFAPPPQPLIGVNTWTAKFKGGEKLFNQRYKPSKGEYAYTPSYPNRYSLSGEFIQDGPLASNAYIS